MFLVHRIFIVSACAWILKYFSDQFLEKDIAWPTTYVRNDRLHSQPQLTGHNDGFRCRTRGEKVGSGQWHEWKTQAKPCPGRQPHTLPPSGAPLFSSARVLIPAVRFCPSLVLLPRRGVELCNRALGPIIPAHEGKIRWDFYQNHEKGRLRFQFPLIPCVVLLYHFTGLQAPSPCCPPCFRHSIMVHY